MVSVPVDFEIFEMLLFSDCFPSLSESMPNITMMPFSGLWEWNADISCMSSLGSSFDIGLMNQIIHAKILGGEGFWPNMVFT